MEAQTVDCKGVDPKAVLSVGRRAGAAMSTGAVERFLGRGVTAAGALVCLTTLGCGSTRLTGVSTDVTGLEEEVAESGKLPWGRIKCTLLPTSITAVPRGM